MQLLQSQPSKKDQLRPPLSTRDRPQYTSSPSRSRDIRRTKSRQGSEGTLPQSRSSSHSREVRSGKNSQNITNIGTNVDGFGRNQNIRALLVPAPRDYIQRQCAAAFEIPQLSLQPSNVIRLQRPLVSVPPTALIVGAPKHRANPAYSYPQNQSLDSQGNKKASSVPKRIICEY